MKREPTDLFLNIFLLQQVNLSIKPAQCHKCTVNTARKLLFSNASVKGLCFDRG